MSWKLRQEKEIRRLLAQGRAVSATREATDEEGRPYYVTATLRKVGQQYHLLLDSYYAVGVTGKTISEEGKIFDDIDQALKHLSDSFGIPLHKFKV